jgi:site-specific DNA recombinase
VIATKKSIAAQTVRVAIYTRVSVADGLEKEFNSIEAQRDACEAYAASQRASGWTALLERYDDGGYTGANTDRPAFQRLLADVEAGKIDVVAVYKIDRLSRSLLDFTQLLDAFRQHGVAFVSVTQSFDTSTSMGRMVVSLLATFAQFERETTAERVRDKVHASRRRGMWTGGRPVLGYDVVSKKLVVNAAESERVRAIFALYRDLGALLPTVHELNARGWNTKSWTTQEGRHQPGHAWTNTTLQVFLTNPLFIGRVRAGDDLVAGQHEAIVDLETWDAVQAQLSSRSPVQRGWRPPKRSGALLRGLLRCSCGASMIRTTTRRKSRAYSFYVCGRVLKLGAAACPGSRAAAGALDQLVIERIRAVGRDPAILRATLAADRDARETRRPELEAEVRRLSQERGRAQSERGNVADAIAKGAASMVERLAELDAHVAEADLRLSDAQRDLAALDAGAIDVDELRRALAEFEPVWSQLAVAERARVVALLLERVTFHADSGEVEITFRPGGPRLLHTCPAAGALPGGWQANHPSTGEPQ